MRRLAGGELEFHGRIDHQVKLRGFRIELGEVEAALAALPEVGEAAVLVRDDLPEGRGLVAFLAPAAGAPLPTAAELREALKRRLPEPLVPARFVELPALPLTSNGKVDRRALEMLPVAALTALASPGAAGPAQAAPATPAEALLADLYAEVLGRPRVGVDESFFELGGHSLLATQVTSRLREATGLEVPLRWLFEQPTARGLAALLEPRLPAGWSPPPRRRPAAPGDAAGPEGAGSGGAAAARGLPLSYAQERLWLLDRLAPEAPPPVLRLALHLAGGLDAPALAAALGGVALRHAVLRSRFAAGEDGSPAAAALAGEPAATLPVADLSGLAAARRAYEAERLAAGLVARPFDLAAGRPFRALLVRLGGDRHRALVAVHRIAADDRSGEILAGDLAEFYAAAVERRAPRLAALPWQMADYAVRQRLEVEKGALDRQLAYWRSRLAGAPEALELPFDRQHGARGGAWERRPPATVAVHLPAGLGACLEALPAPLPGALLAGFAALLGRLSGQRDLVVGLPADLREQPEAERLIGPLVNFLPLRLALGGDPPFADLARAAGEELRAGLAHRELPFERLLEALAPDRRLGRAPVFQALFACDLRPPVHLALPGLVAGLERGSGDGVGLDLALRLRRSRQELAAGLDYDPDLLDGTTAGRWAGHLATLLAGAAADPALQLSHLPLLSAAERHQLLAEWTVPSADVGLPAVPLPALFEAQAERAPGATAVATAAGERLTYGELDAWAEALAAALDAAGAGPEDLVAVCVERSPGAVAALLGVLRSGAVYLPLDPEYPEERLRRVLADSGATIALASRAQAGRPALAPLRRIALEAAAAADAASPALPRRSEGAEGAGREGRRAQPLESLAYVLYTSGSTGAPRAVGVPHGAAAEHCRAIARAFGLGPADRVLQFAAPAFDVALEQVLPALAAGAAVVLRDREPWDPAELSLHVERLGLTVVDLPTAYWQRWVRETAGRPGAPPPSLRLVVVGGEAMPAAAARDWRRTPVAAIRLVNAYGPTEAVMTASLAEVGSAALEAGAAVPIGRPIAGRALFAVDGALELAPLGVPAELAVGGPLARGYLGDPAATAERFVPNPHGDPGTRLYRTGDVVRVQAARRPRLPRPGRRPGEDPRLPHRAGRGRGGARRPRRRPRGGRRRATPTSPAAPASSPTPCPSPGSTSTWPPSARRSAPASRSTSCRRASSPSPPCRSHRTARWTARRCRPRPARRRRPRRRRTGPRSRPPHRSRLPPPLPTRSPSGSRRPSPRCSSASRSRSTRGSSPPAVTRSSPPRWSPACGEPSASRCRFA